MADKVEEEYGEQERRGRRCRKCKAHGKINYLKNYHRKKCEFKDCDCKTCSSVTRTRERSKIVLQNKRQMVKERKLREQRDVGVLPVDFQPNLYRGMPVVSNRQSPRFLLSPTNQQSLAHFTQFQTYVTSMAKLVARILHQTASPQDIPSNLYDVVARTFYPSWPISPTISGPTNGPYVTTFGVPDNMGPVTVLPQPLTVNPNEVRFGSNWAVGLPQTCSCSRCTGTSYMYIAIPNQDVTSVQQ